MFYYVIEYSNTRRCRFIDTTDLCILDDNLARKYATKAGLNVSGTLGVLMDAKNKAYIKEVKPIMDRFKNEGGMYIDNELYSVVLDMVNES